MDPIHEAQPRRLRRIDRVPERHQLEGALLPQIPAQDRRHHRGHETEPHLRVAEAGALRREHEVARRREAAPAGERAAVHDRDHRFRELPQQREEFAQRFRLPQAGHDPLLDRSLHLRQVGARAEVRAAPPDPDHPHPGVRLGERERLLQFRDERPAQRIAALRTVEADPVHAGPFVDLYVEVFEHEPLGIPEPRLSPPTRPGDGPARRSPS